MGKYVLHYKDEVVYEIEANSKDEAIAIGDQYWSERVVPVVEVGQEALQPKDWGEEERAITLTNAQWNRLTTFLLMTTRYRNGELEAWEKLSLEKNEDGTPTFKNAQSNIEFWRGMIEDIEAIRESIDGTALEQTIARATEKANETNSIGSKDSFEFEKE